MHSLDAPAPTVGGPAHPIIGIGGGLVMHSGLAVRRLLGVELWKLQGGSEKMWSLLVGDKLQGQDVRPTGQVKEAILRGVPAQQAVVMVDRWDALEMRGGRCPTEDRPEVEEELRRVLV